MAQPRPRPCNSCSLCLPSLGLSQASRARPALLLRPAAPPLPHGLLCESGGHVSQVPVPFPASVSQDTHTKVEQSRSQPTRSPVRSCVTDQSFSLPSLSSQCQALMWVGLEGVRGEGLLICVWVPILRSPEVQLPLFCEGRSH